MAREQYREQRPTGEAAVSAEAETPAPTAATTYVSQGPIPPVATAPAVTAPTASERAFGHGPGVTKLEALLAAGTPKPEQVVDLIDAHRDEHEAMLALVSARLGGAFADSVRARMDHVRASVSRRELVAGDPADPNSGYVVVSQKEGGAKWRTPGGDFTGTANKDGLDAKYRLDQDDALHAHVTKDKSGTLAWERDGKNMGELYGHYGSSSDYEAGARKQFDLGGGTLTAGAHHQVQAGHATEGAFGTYKHGATTTDAALGVREGHLVESGGVAHDFGGGYSGSARLAHGPEGTTGALAGQYQDARTHVDANVTRGVGQTSLHLGASEQLSAQQSLSGTLDHTRPDHGASQTTLGLSERYRSGSVIHGLDLQAGSGARDYVKTTGSVDAQLGPHLYGGAFGASEIQGGHHATAQLGASLTFTSTDKTALTLAGLVDQDGNLETRLQLDVFKSRIESIGDLDRQKKDALVSVFLSYTQGSTQRQLDGRFGAPQLETGAGSQVTAGIKIKF